MGGAAAIAYDRTMDVTIRFEPVGRSIRVAAGTTILEAARMAGAPLASGCGAGGTCARCGVRIVAGADSIKPEDIEERRVKMHNRIDPGLRLACRVAAIADLEVTTTYW